MKRIHALGALVALTVAAGAVVGDDVEVPKQLILVKAKDAKLSIGHYKGWVGVFRTGEKKPLLVSNATEGRPYVHPITAPDGKGVLTEFSPAHHKHQTGLYVGFVKVNGHDYFHNRGEYYHLRFASKMREEVWPTEVAGNTAQWYTESVLLGEKKKPILAANSLWKFTDHKSHYLLDLEWSGTPIAEVTFGKHDYGGLFLRMPWRQKTGGKAVNSEGDENGKAEGKKAKWVDVGMPIEGRKGWGHIAILDHKDNPRHPVAWRVDGQLGVGPALTRSGDYKLKKGETLTLKYRFVVYTGELDKKLIEKAWKEFTDKKK